MKLLIKTIIIIIIIIIIIMTMMIIGAVVIGALGSVTEGFDKWIEKLEILCNIAVMQKTALIGTARILRKVLEM